ncbi:hypothetical protein [Roseimaritima ulvae]|uniref:Uncharacterized protein n=1 Tax=Roseimaritima ulvae TaxID=980254 RepID=A0A5B9QR73_9BACT|nr:hypothetical protein [Roseimaritima ulvae]QEG40442.1 hypothetical protein UC8_24540 [Roseimaritima ulvae]
MLDYKTDIEPHEAVGRSDAEIATYLSALCNRPLPCGTIVAMCSAAQVVYRDLDTEKLTGPLWTALKESPNPLAQWFMRHVWLDRREQITLDGSASDVPGVDSFAVVSGFGALALQLGATSPAFEGIRLGMIEAAGGLQYPDHVTEVAVAEARTAAADAADAAEAQRVRYGYLAEAMEAATAAVDAEPTAELQTVSEALSARLAAVWGS